jgi:hypothetical protein
MGTGKVYLKSITNRTRDPLFINQYQKALDFNSELCADETGEPEEMYVSDACFKEFDNKEIIMTQEENASPGDLLASLKITNKKNASNGFVLHLKKYYNSFEEYGIISATLIEIQKRDDKIIQGEDRYFRNDLNLINYDNPRGIELIVDAFSIDKIGIFINESKNVR